MKKYILSIVLFVAVAASSFAQKGQQKSPEETAKQATENLTKELALTPEQKEKVYAAALERANAIEAARTEAGEGNKPDPEKMKAIGKKYNETVKAVLTDEQKEKQKASAEAMKAKKQQNQ
ncbi:hypothetical protein N9R54_00045 [Pelobium sp.]|nr:hypothetical protein [Pelobium sp.]MDA9554597.1 hypothetical protein [Pelobium sp.]